MSLLLGMSSMLAAHQVDLEAENTALKTEVQKLQHQVQKLQRQQAGAEDIWVQPNMEDIAASRPNIIIIFGDVRPRSCHHTGTIGSSLRCTIHLAC